jgi:D-alanine-D-alanine ligase
MKKINLALIYGGISEEREVSLNSGEEVEKAIESDFNLEIIDPKQDLEKLFAIKDKIDLAFPILHGKYGEDGTIQGMLDILGTPYVGSDCLPSSIGMDKLIFKRLLKSKGFSYPQTYINKGSFKKPPFDGPWFVKPNSQGSSLGISRAENMGELKEAYALAKEYEQTVHIEKEIQGLELTCGVMEESGTIKALPIVEIVPKNDFFDYDAKYDGTTKEIVPAIIDQETTDKVQRLASNIFKLVGARDFSRIDFMIDKNRQPYILEINTIPGMTNESLLPKEAKAAGYSFRKFLIAIIENAWERSLEKN